MLRIASVIAVCIFLVALILPVSGQSGIIVDNADGLLTLDFTPSSTLNNLLNSVPARVAVQSSNNLRSFALSDLPAPLKSLLEGVTQRVVAQYANSTRSMALADPPTGLQTLLASIPARVVFEYTNSNLQATLVYPRELINDKVAPVSSAFALVVEANETHLTWKTNEFARCDLHYGTQPGNYTETIENPLYEKQHDALIDSLVPDTTYYGQVICTDQSENTATSSEFTFVHTSEPEQPANRLSLPMVKR